MATKPLTSEAISLTEKKMDMALDDIIKMSKAGTNKLKKHRVPNRAQKPFNNVSLDKTMKLRRFMDSRSSLRQGVLAQKRSNFKGNQFPLAVEAARRAAVVPIRNRTFNQSRGFNVSGPRTAAPRVQKSSPNGGFAMKQKQLQLEVKGILKQKPQTLDSLFANMKEQRMRTFSQHRHQNNSARRNGPAQQQRPRPPWGRYNNW